MVVKQDIINLYNNIQEQDLQECIAASGLTNIQSLIDAEYNIVKTFDYSNAIYRDNKLCAIIGYKKLYIDNHKCLALMALTTKEIIHRKIDYYKEAIKFINKAKKVCNKLLFCTISSYKEALSMNKRLGFKYYREIMINGNKFEIDMLGV